MSDDESFDEFYAKLNDIVNSAYNLGEIYDQPNIVRKIIRSLTPINNKVQESHACSHKTALVGIKPRVDRAWDFSDYCVEFYDNYQIRNPEAIKVYLPAFETWLDRSWS